MISKFLEERWRQFYSLFYGELIPFSLANLNSYQLAFVFVGLNLLITIPLAVSLNIWMDEAYSLDTSGQTLGYAFSQAITFEEQAPLYFVSLHAWRQIHDSAIWARFFSVLCASSTIVLTPHLSSKFIKGLHPIWLTAAVAFNPFLIWAALEIRLYALSILLSCLLLLLFYDGYLSPGRRISARFLYVIFAIFGLYTHYFLGFLLAINGVILLLYSRFKKSTILPYLFDLLIIGVCFIPMASIVVNQALTAGVDNTGAFEVSQSFISSQVKGMKMIVGQLLFHTIPAPEVSQWASIRIGFFSLLLGWVVRWRRLINEKVWLIWIGTVLLLILFSQTFAIFDLHFRHANIILLPCLLSIMVALQLPTGKWRQRSLAIGLSIVLCFSGLSLWVKYRPLAKQGDSRRVASYLEMHERPGQPILVFNPEVEMTLSHYYDGVNELIALPDKEEFKTYSLYELTLQSEQDVIERLNRSSQSNDDIWLVTDEGLLTNLAAYQESYKILEQFVDSRYQALVDQPFYGARIRLLEPK